MSEVSDELLMAYADDELDLKARAEVERFLAANPAEASRVAMFRRTGRVLSVLFAEALREPVPRALVEQLARENGAAGVAALRGRRPPAGFRWRRSTSWAIAASFAAVLCGGTGWLWIKHFAAVGPSNRLLADASLSAALETVASGRTASITFDGTQGNFRPIYSFATRDSHYCRRYDVVRSGREGLQGVACRGTDGSWRVEVQVVQAAKTGAPSGIKPAGRDESAEVEGLVDRTISGDPFDDRLEQRLIDGHWTAAAQR